jgi:hypothetical protein
MGKGGGKGSSITLALRYKHILRAFALNRTPHPFSLNRLLFRVPFLITTTATAGITARAFIRVKDRQVLAFEFAVRSAGG